MYRVQSLAIAAPSSPITGIRGCCARTASGQAVAAPVIPMMNSRRRIAFTKAGLRRIGRDYSRDLRPAKWGSGSVCRAAILSHPYPLWVKSRHRKGSAECPLYPQKRTLELSRAMSALCQKQTSACSFDQVISNRKYAGRNCQAERLSSR